MAPSASCSWRKEKATKKRRVALLGLVGIWISHASDSYAVWSILWFLAVVRWRSPLNGEWNKDDGIIPWYWFSCPSLLMLERKEVSLMWPDTLELLVFVSRFYIPWHTRFYIAVQSYSLLYRGSKLLAFMLRVKFTHFYIAWQSYPLIFAGQSYSLLDCGLNLLAFISHDKVTRFYSRVKVTRFYIAGQSYSLLYHRIELLAFIRGSKLLSFIRGSKLLAFILRVKFTCFYVAGQSNSVLYCGVNAKLKFFKRQKMA